MEKNYLSVMDADILKLVKSAFSLAWRYPAYILPFYRIVGRQKQAARLRRSFGEDGLTIPAFLIVSVTRKCNLNCQGCYSQVAAQGEVSRGRNTELDAGQLARIVDEANDLGVSFILLAGGEPLVRAREIVAMADRNPRMIFPVFTNGTLIDEKLIRDLRTHRNLIPILSVEGGAANTDQRRGEGVHHRVHDQMQKLRRAGVFFGVSFTVMKGNSEEISRKDFVRGLVREGAGVFFYNEFTPVQDGSENLCIDAVQRAKLLTDLAVLRSEVSALFLAFPGDEDRYGGCLSSGRGFAHIAPDGGLEACPFAPFGDTDTRDNSLLEALRSPMLNQIRAHHGELAETSGGCALWNRRAWVEGLGTPR